MLARDVDIVDPCTYVIIVLCCFMLKLADKLKQVQSKCTFLSSLFLNITPV